MLDKASTSEQQCLQDSLQFCSYHAYKKPLLTAAQKTKESKFCKEMSRMGPGDMGLMRQQFKPQEAVGEECITNQTLTSMQHGTYTEKE